MNNRKTPSCRFSDPAGRILAVVMLSLACAVTSAQGRLELLPVQNRSVSAFSLGIGSAASLDTYLSPCEYSGAYLACDYDCMSLGSGDGFFPYRHLYLNLGYGFLKNHSGSMNASDVMVHAYGSWSHELVSSGIWESLLGISALGDLGAVMNMANTNNPVNAKFQMSSGATFDNIVHFRVKNRPMAVKGTLYLPLLGVSFAPDHDQFYWNMQAEGGLSGDFHIVTPFNAQTMSAQFALDIPVCGRVVQIGYGMYLMRHRLGGNFSGLWHSYATVGFVHRFERLKWK